MHYFLFSDAFEQRIILWKYEEVILFCERYESSFGQNKQIAKQILLNTLIITKKQNFFKKKFSGHYFCFREMKCTFFKKKQQNFGGLMSNLLHCALCNAQFSSKEELYDHTLAHESFGNGLSDDDLEITSDVVVKEKVVMIPCEYANCTRGMIPMDEYDDHLHLHQLHEESISSKTGQDDALLKEVESDAENESSHKIEGKHHQLSLRLMHPLITDTQELNKVYEQDQTISKEVIFKKKKKNTKIKEDDHYVANVIPAIQYLLNTHKVYKDVYEYYLCDDLRFYWRDKEDYSWGCGFRNTQMLCSSLLLAVPQLCSNANNNNSNNDKINNNDNNNNDNNNNNKIIITTIIIIIIIK
ncbi:hypothetical protein RFI_22927 [Reticulomyxa filosa]|uniref:C2H2-type domain-containing protein n=1 Tax=Reticulomyxa filosa TaxID=46433 RepID=X6MLY9_RETFI|nr:hypothetical protein RFI_22927 [Reticulomyxa filosa]|eukprot:ETO14442.1 hypothetical protein RFI_22927 [Reticulomyxa filosa]